ncbi:MAG: M20/M25/M40 family metallo-hydrolase, partial [Candidatus Margulisiibacteriota bacterium]
MTIKKVLDYAFENQKSFQQDLFKCLEIASISTLSNHHQDILNCSFLVATHLSEIGLSNVKQFENYGNPIIYADNGYDPRKPTVLFYGHYDVQPVDPIELWDAPPFSPIIKDDYIFARGASDNKGMFYSQIKAVESYLKVDGGCPVNIKFVIEGEEEIGSEGLIRFIKDKPDLLSHDVLLVSDSPKFSTDQPSICKSIRGLVYFDVQVKSILSDVHSGQLGGGVPN